MNIIIFTDVFGITPGLIKLQDELGANTIVDPYQGKMMNFDNEAHAYSFFITNIGLDSYFSIVSNVLASINRHSTLIGFSVGASAIWSSSLCKKNHFIKEAYCFYGSQIRNFTKITPDFTINLIFPEQELHFDVCNLIKVLEVKNKVDIVKTKYLHGFMNVYSDNFNEQAYNYYVDLFKEEFML